MQIRLILCIIISFMFMSQASFAKDRYFKSNPVWQTQFNIEDGISVSSTKRLSWKQIELVKYVYYQTKVKFITSIAISHGSCDPEPFDIRIINNHYELNNRVYFPGENTYADEPVDGNDIMFGRYYRKTNRLYIVPPDLSEYYFKENFAHEALHYFFDICKIRFKNNSKEHIAVYKFLHEYKDTFNRRKDYDRR